MINIIVALIILLIVILAAGYVIREKKRGVKCIGCSAGGKCSGGCEGCSKN